MEDETQVEIAKIRADLKAAQRAYKLAEIDARAFRGLAGSDTAEILADAAFTLSSLRRILKIKIQAIA